MVKRFRVETNKIKERFSFLTDHPKSKILFCSVKENPRIKYTIKIKGKPMTGEVSISDFMEVKGWKAVGNRLSDQALTAVKEIEMEESKLLPKAEPTAMKQTSLFGEEETPSPAEPQSDNKTDTTEAEDKKTYRAGDTIEFD
jgi:topoisomerase-4 subunit A